MGADDHGRLTAPGAADEPGRGDVASDERDPSEPVPDPSRETASEEVRLRDVATAFVVKGNFTYGGGSATIATLHREIVERRGWLPEKPFQLSFALSRLTPGTNLLAFSACIGYLLRRMPGAVVALLAGSLPCAAMALALTAVYSSWSQYAVVQVATRGAVAAAVAVTFITGVTLIRPHWRTASRPRLAVFVGGAFGAAEFLHASPLLVLVAAGVAGLIWPGPSHS
jgi:chromate transporter